MCIVLYSDLYGMHAHIFLYPVRIRYTHIYIYIHLSIYRESYINCTSCMLLWFRDGG